MLDSFARCRGDVALQWLTSRGYRASSHQQWRINRWETLEEEDVSLDLSVEKRQVLVMCGSSGGQCVKAVLGLMLFPQAGVRRV